jgi:hypothetical protein
MKFMIWCQRKDGLRNGVWFGQRENGFGVARTFDTAQIAELHIADRRVNYTDWLYEVRGVDYEVGN